MDQFHQLHSVVLTKSIVGTRHCQSNPEEVHQPPSPGVVLFFFYAGVWCASHYFCYAALLPNPVKGSALHDVWASRGENTAFLKESAKANMENIWGGPPVPESVFITVIVQEVFLLANVSRPMQIAQVAAAEPSGSLWLRLTNTLPVYTPNTHRSCHARKSHSARLSQHPPAFCTHTFWV